MLLSLGTNFLTRIPGLIGVLWFLPLLRSGLGVEGYADLLTSMALGASASFLIGGTSVIGRRLIGEAYASGGPIGEADGFVSLMVASAAVFVLALGGVAAFCYLRGADTTFLVISMIPVTCLFANTFDNVRSAYNEHYVTAILLIVFQVIIYSIGFLVPGTRNSIVLGALVLQAPYFFASVVTGLLLLRDRSYLAGGRPSAAWQVMHGGTTLALADGFLITSLSLSVVWLQASASAATAAWFGSIVRLFQIFLVPIVLLLTPLSSYIRIFWNTKSVMQQQVLIKATLSIGLGYGAIVAIVLFFASWLYVDRLLNLAAPGGLSEILPSFLLFGAIVAYRSYSSIAYLVLDEFSHLSSWTAGVVAAAVLLGTATSFAIDPLSAINVYALAAGMMIIMVLFWNVTRSDGLPRSASAS